MHTHMSVDMIGLFVLRDMFEVRNIPNDVQLYFCISVTLSRYLCQVCSIRMATYGVGFCNSSLDI